MLHLIATPIGNPRDITLRAIDTLKMAEVVIGEERREVSKLLKSLGIEGKTLALLNEHSKDQDVQELLDLCRTSHVALVTDCGTPGFCDPGARLVAACRRAGLVSSPLPGASSLMCLLSVSGADMRQFLFRGFLPAEKELRAKAIRELAREPRPVILMDTPYRLTRLLSELSELWPSRKALIGIDFTLESEQIIEASLAEMKTQVGERKAEFILAVYPTVNPTVSAHEASSSSKRESSRRFAPSKSTKRPSRSGGKRHSQQRDRRK